MEGEARDADPPVPAASSGRGGRSGHQGEAQAARPGHHHPAGQGDGSHREKAAAGTDYTGGWRAKGDAPADGGLGGGAGQGGRHGRAGEGQARRQARPGAQDDRETGPGLVPQ